MTLIIAPLAEELRYFTDQLEDTVLLREFRFPVLRGRLDPVGETVLAVIGSGKVQAAIHTASLVSRLSPQRLFCVGIAAGVDPSLRLGEVVQVTDAVQYDLNIGRFGLKRGMINGTLPVYAEADTREDGIPAVRCGTADIFLTKGYVEDSPWLTGELGVQIADMESYAVIAAAEEASVPCMVYRVISDTMAGERPSDFKEFMQEASQSLFRAVAGMP